MILHQEMSNLSPAGSGNETGALSVSVLDAMEAVNARAALHSLTPALAVTQALITCLPAQPGELPVTHALQY